MTVLSFSQHWIRDNSNAYCIIHVVVKIEKANVLIAILWVAVLSNWDFFIVAKIAFKFL